MNKDINLDTLLRDIDYTDIITTIDESLKTYTEEDEEEDEEDDYSYIVRGGISQNSNDVFLGGTIVLFI